MSAILPKVTESTRTTWGIALAAGSLLLIAAGTVIWSARDTETERPAGNGDPVILTAQAPPMRVLPVPPPALMLHSVAVATENGVRVMKIKVTDSGDELIVDAATGRLLEARPSRPTPPLPAAKFAAPFDPMT